MKEAPHEISCIVTSISHEISVVGKSIAVTACLRMQRETMRKEQQLLLDFFWG